MSIRILPFARCCLGSIPEVAQDVLRAASMLAVDALPDLTGGRLLTGKTGMMEGCNTAE